MATTALLGVAKAEELSGAHGDVHGQDSNSGLALWGCGGGDQ